MSDTLEGNYSQREDHYGQTREYDWIQRCQTMQMRIFNGMIMAAESLQINSRHLGDDQIKGCNVESIIQIDTQSVEG